MTTTTDTGMHPGERLLLYVLRELDDGSGAVTVTNGELAKRCGWSASFTVRKRLHGLEDRGLLTTTRNVDEFGSHLANTYTLRKG
jgi:repressor of nif and glnA expression